MELISRTLQGREIVSKSAGNSFFQGPFERFGACSQGILYPIGIMETGPESVN